MKDFPPSTGFRPGVTVHYEAQFAAEGGPGTTLPELDGFDPVEFGTMSLVCVPQTGSTPKFAIVDSQGFIFAESTKAAKLMTWMTAYAETLDRMAERGEL